MSKIRNDGTYLLTQKERALEERRERNESYLKDGEWRDVVFHGYQTPYKVCRDGRILNTTTGRLVEGSVSNGYRKMQLYYQTEEGLKDSKVNQHWVVANAFLENPNDWKILDFLDGNHMNIAAENLRWLRKPIARMIEEAAPEIRIVPESELSGLIMKLAYTKVNPDEFAREEQLNRGFVEHLVGLSEWMKQENVLPISDEFDFRWVKFEICGSSQHGYLISPYGFLMIEKTRRIIQGTLSPDGCMRVQLTYWDGKENRAYNTGVAQLIANRFVEHVPEKDMVLWKDGNKLHFWSENLEWVDRIEFKERRGGNRGKYDEKKIREVCEMMCIPLPPKIIAEKTGVNRNDQNHIRRGEILGKIVREYEFPKGRFFNNGTFHYDDGRVLPAPDGYQRDTSVTGVSKYTDDEIRELCKLLTDPALQWDEIAEKLGVPMSLVRDVKSRKIFQNISKDYRFPHVIDNGHSRKYFWD